MLEVRQLDAFYGDSHILHGIDLQVPTGGRVAVLGRNGAGKSTLLKTIANAGPRGDGAIVWDGRDLGVMAPFARSRLGMAFVPEDRRILGSLTVLENLRMAWQGTPRERRSGTPQEVLEQFPMLVPLSARLGGLLSGGQQQLVALARAAISQPKLLLLDEPTEGLAPLIVEQLTHDVNAIGDRTGGALLLCEQNVWFSRRCTDYVYIIETGRIVFSGSWEMLDAQDDMRTRHLGI
ncbi:ATP-binding cassette domain-containing protein [soil metagenome]